MNERNELLFSLKNAMRIFKCCTKMYMACTWNGIEIVFNKQTVPILVLCVKTLCGIDFVVI